MIRQGGIGIVNYGSGNIASLRSSLMKIGYRARILNAGHDFDGIKVIVVPGVGAFPSAMANLRRTGLDKTIIEARDAGVRVIGICLGMQLLAERSYEFERTEGLSLIKGEVHPHTNGLQVGWMSLLSQYPESSYENTQHYFNHSYCLEGPAEQVLYTAQGSAGTHAAIVRQGSVIGIQFHPEKSQRIGLELLSDAIGGTL